MPLSAQHDGRSLARAVTLSSAEPTVGDVLSRLPSQEIWGSSGGADPSTSSALIAEDFARRHMQVRDRLAWRSACGEHLTDRERATLLALDSILDSLDPPAEPLPLEVQAILRDIPRR